MTINKIDKGTQIVINKAGIKQYYRGDLMLQTDKTGKTLVNTKEMKIVAKKPLTQDTFEKQKGKGIDAQGRITNDNGLINN